MNVSKDGVLNSPSGKTTALISNTPLLEFAYLSNKEITNDDRSNSTTIKFNTINLNWSDFETLFFTPTGQFFLINQANANSQALSFNQTYQDITNKSTPFSLYRSVLNEWATSNNLSIESIPIYKKLQLTKQCYLMNSLANIRGSVQGLSLNECINLLLQNGEIIYTGDIDTCAIVTFVLINTFYSDALNTSVNLHFQYKTCIPNYINNNAEPTPYSYDITPSRKLFDLKDDLSEAEEKKPYYPNTEKKSVNHEYSNNDEHTIFSNEGEIINEVNQIIHNSVDVSDDKSAFTSVDGGKKW